MRITNIILPKTDPEIVAANAKAFIEKISATEDYQKALKAKNRYFADTEMVDGFIVIAMCASGLTMFLFRTVWVVLLASAAFFAGTMFLAFYQIYTYCKAEKTFLSYTGCDSPIYEERIKYRISDVFTDFSDDSFLMDSNVLKVIRLLKKWAPKDNVEYLIEPNSYEDIKNHPYNPVLYRILQCKDGAIIDYLELRENLLGENGYDMMTKNPGVLDFSFLDDAYWHGYTPYYEDKSSPHYKSPSSLSQNMILYNKKRSNIKNPVIFGQSKAGCRRRVYSEKDFDLTKVPSYVKTINRFEDCDGNVFYEYLDDYGCEND